LKTKGKIYGVSLGPGDPGLITMKGWQVLQRADKIYYPGSLLPGGGMKSYSLTILQQLGLTEEKLCPVLLSMDAERAYNLDAYEAVFKQIKADCENGMQVAYVCEGDISFYSTFAYILHHINAAQLPVEIVAGIPSFLLAMALHQQPLAVLQERIAIVPFPESQAQLENYLTSFHTVVLIKVRHALAYIEPLVAAGKAVMLYGEKLGTAEQFISTGANELAQRQLPYFSLIILKSTICV
jgi:precorrin-2/cobalt-factor-2 C20-methyltransferase